MRLFASLRNLLRCERGLAMIEFAFAAPMFVTLVLVGLELTNLAMAHLTVSQMAMSVADNAGRVQSSVDEANVYEVFAGADLVAEAIDFEDHGRIVLSSIEDNGESGSNAGQWIRWQRCWGNLEVNPAYGVQGDGADDDALEEGMGASGHRIAAASGTAVMFVEAVYEYQPLVGSGFFTPPTIRYESAFNVRGRQNQAITNTQSLTQRTCEIY